MSQNELERLAFIFPRLTKAELGRHLERHGGDFLHTVSVLWKHEEEQRREYRSALDAPAPVTLPPPRPTAPARQEPAPAPPDRPDEKAPEPEEAGPSQYSDMPPLETPLPLKFPRVRDPWEERQARLGRQPWEPDHIPSSMVPANIAAPGGRILSGDAVTELNAEVQGTVADYHARNRSDEIAARQWQIRSLDRRRIHEMPTIARTVPHIYDHKRRLIQSHGVPAPGGTPAHSNMATSDTRTAPSETSSGSGAWHRQRILPERIEIRPPPRDIVLENSSGFQRTVLTTKPDEWRYLAEGNANIVFRYVGGTEKLVGRVLRFRKVGGEVGDNSFAHKFLQAAVGTEYICDLVPVALLKRWTTDLLFIHESARPDKRLYEHALKMRDNIRKRNYRIASKPGEELVQGYLLSDHTHLSRALESQDVWTVEIKPKWGFLTRSRWVHEKSPKRFIDRYTMHQTLKLAQGKVKRRSAFNPLAFFSGVRTRLARVMDKIFKTPQNNLKMFHTLWGKTERLEYGKTFMPLKEILTEILMQHKTMLDALRRVQMMDSQWT